MRKTTLYLQCLMLILFGANVRLLYAQAPFSREFRVFQILETSSQLAVFTVTPGSNVLQADAIFPLPQVNLNALGFRKQDNFLYAVAYANNHLYRIGSDGVSVDLGNVGLDNSSFYLAGDVSADGKYLVCIGSNSSGYDVHVAKINLSVTPFTTDIVPLSSSGQIKDIAFELNTNNLFGYDELNRKIVKIDYFTGFVNSNFVNTNIENQILTLYSDPFGELYAYGRAVNGIVDGLFQINKITGKEKRLATGPIEYLSDGASCPYGVAIKNAIDPGVTLPCSDITSKYIIANGSGETLTGINLEHSLPQGMYLAGILQNQLGVFADTVSAPGTLRFNQFDLQPGNKLLDLKLKLADLPKGNFRTQATLQQVPVLYGSVIKADNPATAGFLDSAVVTVNRFDEDTLNYRWLICYGQSLELDGSQFGGQVRWNNGSTATALMVDKGGLFTLTAGNVCESIVVNHDVTAASCPFTIAMDHEVLPNDTFFPCSEVTFRFILRNDSGEERHHILFTDTLPTGFTFETILRNPFGGQVIPGTDPYIISIENLLLKKGRDTLDILVRAGEVTPGNYKNRAYIHNIPIVMGPFRMSDDPNTFVFDSTAMHLRGSRHDSVTLTEKICINSPHVLNGGQFGFTFLWENGSTDSVLVVQDTGLYLLQVLDGCIPTNIYWNVVEGGHIHIYGQEQYAIHQGETIDLLPGYDVTGDTLLFYWNDPEGASLSCLDCPKPEASPLNNIIYSFSIDNGVCSDTAFYTVKVDKTRRVYTGNVFSPDDDGINDFFFLQSPDAGIIKHFAIADRWGNLIISHRNAIFNDPQTSGWDGTFRGRNVESGVYFWQAQIEFPDGEVRVFSGDVTILR